MSASSLKSTKGTGGLRFEETMAFWENYFHVVWATYRRSLIIQTANEDFIASMIRQKSSELQCPVHAVNMMPDHVHVAVSIKPSISQFEWVRQIKGITAREMNRAYNLDSHFRWQKSFGISTLGKRQLPIVIEYIENQKNRHANNDIYIALENCGDNS